MTSLKVIELAQEDFSLSGRDVEFRLGDRWIEPRLFGFVVFVFVFKILRDSNVFIWACYLFETCFRLSPSDWAWSRLAAARLARYPTTFKSLDADWGIIRWVCGLFEFISRWGYNVHTLLIILLFAVVSLSQSFMHRTLGGLETSLHHTLNASVRSLPLWLRLWVVLFFLVESTLCSLVEIGNFVWHLH